MKLNINTDHLVSAGLSSTIANQTIAKIETLIKKINNPSEAWQLISNKLLSHEYPFQVHQLIFSSLFPDWHEHPENAPVVIPGDEVIQNANITKFMKQNGFTDIKTFHDWTVNQPEAFLKAITSQLNIIFDHAPDKMCDLSKGVESPVWFKGARLNIVNSCFNASPKAAAIIYQDKNKKLCTLNYETLNLLSNRIANSLVAQGFEKGDAIGIAMPMNYFAIAIYLGIIKMGGIVVSIADSFSSEEMAVRLKIANAKAIFTQDFIFAGNKKIPLYEKVKNNSHPLRIIIFQDEKNTSFNIRDNDLLFDDFLIDNDQFSVVSCDPMSPINILFSSGTTGTPKAIPWNHTTAIKAASDAWFHQNIRHGDVLAWPTSLGWMMGPWLIFAALINQGTIAIYTGSPKEREFGEFIQNAKVNMLGLVPTLVAYWRQTHCMEKLDWSAIKVFSSTGECSNPDDMFYLMSLAGYKPVIEYCGGTEIGGAYVSSTVIENNFPSLFTTPTMGSDFTIIENGEVAIIPPSIGLSTVLLNADHHEIYFANMPQSQNGKKLRRHGDQMQQLPGGHYSMLGRVDDTMNLGGIKISSAEIERVLTTLPDIIEVAAIAIPPKNNGPSLLVIYAATNSNPDKNLVMKEMQGKINAHLNPLFKIHDVVLTKELPKTASNKIMRRVLRKEYIENNL